MDQPDGHVRQVSRERAEMRFGTNGRKGPAVNFVAIADVVNHAL
jgi:hypothetical protein